MLSSLLIPAFLAGILTFLAPCTFPLLPAFLGFISGGSVEEIKKQKTSSSVRRRMMINAVMYVLGFSLVFILFGALISFIGVQLLGEYRLWLTRIGGVLVILFGLFMLGFLSFDFLQRTAKIHS